MRFARNRGAAEPCEGAIINTGGGMAGGDRLSITVEAGGLANVVLATPTAERIYRSTGPAHDDRRWFAARGGGAARLASARDDPVSWRAPATPP